MFWRFGYSNNPNSNLEQILDAPEIKLEDLLNEEEILQECKSHNKRLIDLLCKPEMLKELLFYTIREDLNEEELFKYPYIASEVFCCEVWTMYESVLSHPTLLKDYWGFLDRAGPLNPLSASYFCKVNLMLLQKMTKEMLEFLKKQENLIPKLLNHLKTAAINEMIIKLVDVEEPMYEYSIIEWLSEKGLIKELVNMMNPQLDEQSHSVSSQLIVDIIALSYINSVTQGINGNALLREVKSRDTIEKLVSFMLDRDAPHCTSALVYGIDILIELIRRAVVSRTMEGASPELANVSESSEVLRGRIKDLMNLLEHSKKLNEISTTIGKMVPLGAERLKICELFAELLRLQNKEINQTMIEHRVLDLFFQFEWNNFLHSTVCDMLMNVFGGSVETNKELIIAVFEDAKITERIVLAQRLNDSEIEKPRGIRIGYMGHLTILADEVLKLYESPEYPDTYEQRLASIESSRILQSGYFEHDDWTEYVNKAYKETKQRDIQPLGGGKPDFVFEHEMGPFDIDVTSEQLARYMTERITNELPDSFAFDDDLPDQGFINPQEFEMSEMSGIPNNESDDEDEDEIEDEDDEDEEEKGVSFAVGKTDKDWVPDFDKAFSADGTLPPPPNNVTVMEGEGMPPVTESNRFEAFSKTAIHSITTLTRAGSAKEVLCPLDASVLAKVDEYEVREQENMELSKEEKATTVEAPSSLSNNGENVAEESSSSNNNGEKAAEESSSSNNNGEKTAEESSSSNGEVK